MTTRPLALTAGEPAGIGPDLCIALAATSGLPDFVVIGDAQLMQQRAETLKSDIRIRVIDRGLPDDLAPSKNELLVIDLPFPVAVECGTPSENNAQTLLDGLALGVEGCLDGRFSALVTAPLSKRVISDGGIPFTGHTEFLAELTKAALPVMLLVAGDMRVALATTHLSLRNVPD
ncbi:MAG: 4-hydroxythreonine-4-phosphate dehydrogenase PdxA, partial [Gammaproteobacteria bacterium]|nr:4-hydroxythreonine-4-phosphate dehydrogenase PdxA [Gammaproteobacteria bacterium]